MQSTKACRPWKLIGYVCFDSWKMIGSDNQPLRTLSVATYINNNDQVLSMVVLETKVMKIR